MLLRSSYQEWLLLINHHPQILIAYPNRRLIFDRLFVEIGYIICRLDNTKTIPIQNILPLSCNNNITVLSLQMQLYWVALCCSCSGVALILGPNGAEDVIRERAADCKHEKSIHFFLKSEKMGKNALFRCMASGHLLHSLTLPRSYILKASVLVVQTFSAIFWGWKSEFTNLFALRMYGSDISNLSRLVKKLFRLYPLSKIVGKRILLRRRIRGNPDLSNLSRLVNAQRRGRIGSRTEKSPSISLELRLHLLL